MPFRNFFPKLLAGLLALALFPIQAPARDTSIAVIVNPGNGVPSVSLVQLRNIFLGAQSFWKDGTQVVPIVRAPSARERPSPGPRQAR